MALATSHGSAAPNSPRSGRLVVVGIDRSRQFLRARRHTMLVRTMRWLLPILSVAGFGVYVFSALGAANWSAKVGLDTIARILPENLTMNNPHYEGFTSDGSSYTVNAATAQQDLRRQGFIKLNGITGKLTDTKKVETDFSAVRGTYDSKRSILTLTDGIDIKSQDGMMAKLQSATIRTKSGLIMSKQPVDVSMPGGRILSDRLTIKQKEKLAFFIGNVRSTLTPNEAEGGAKSTTNSSTAMLGSSDQPVNITASRLNVDRNRGNARFNGNVMAVQGDQSLQSSILDVMFEPDEKKDADGSAGSGAAKKAASGAAALAGGSRIKKIIVPGPLILRRGEQEQVTGDSAEFDAGKQVAAITGNIVMSAGPTRRAVADSANIDSGRDTILLAGNVLVTQDANELRGDRLFVDRAKGTSKLSATAAPGGKPGRITAKLTRQNSDADDAKAKAGKKAQSKKKAAKKAGAGAAMSMTAFKADPKAPIDIVANALKVNDKSKEAVFQGNVEVVQGQLNMKTTQLTAYYSGNSSLISTDTPAAGAPKAGAKKEEGSEVERIKATGKVVVNSQISGQSATGDWADIDMKKNTVTLGGDVILKQGKNIIRATSLKIDLDSGNALIETTPDAAGSGWASMLKPATKGAKAVPLQTIRGGRPSAVFYPMQLQKGAKKGATKGKNKKTGKAAATGATAAASKRADRPRPAAASSWEATTEQTTN